MSIRSEVDARIAALDGAKAARLGSGRVMHDAMPTLEGDDRVSALLQIAHDLTVEKARVVKLALEAKRETRLNPNPASKADVDPDAVEMYTRFHRLEPTDIGEFAASMEFPARVRKLGKATWVTYRSGKVDPETLKKPHGTLDYIHEHDAGVETFDLQGKADTDVPSFIRKTEALCRLGELLGFGWKDGEDVEREAESKTPLPVLYTIPSGKALVVVQDMREILAIMWGGGLGVEGRGIVG